MVKFGERLPRLMVRGWELHYIDYEGLKSILERGGDPVRMTGDFFKKLESGIQRVDHFVEEQLDEIRAAHRAAKNNQLALEGVKSDLDKLRRFVGTNIIAATKIVKKHDKSVDESLRKRKQVADLIMACAGLQKVPAFQEEVLGRVAPGSPSCVAIEMQTSTTTAKGGRKDRVSKEGDDDDDDEQGLRRLPAWLLTGASASATASKDQAALIRTYVSDWTYTDHPTDEAAPIMGSANSDNDSNESPRASGEGGGHGGGNGGKAGAADDDWGVDFSSDAKKWADMDNGERFVVASAVLLKIALVLFALYAFICSLSFLADGFRLVAGRQAGEIFRNSEVFNNPVAGMLVGVLVTVLVQS